MQDQEFKINDKHLFLLGKVRMHSAIRGCLGGAMDCEVHGMSEDMAKHFNELARNGYIESFRAGKTRVSPLMVKSFKLDGHTLWRIAPKGAEVLFTKALLEESISMELRIANRLKGVSSEAVKAMADNPEVSEKFHGVNLGLVHDIMVGLEQRAKEND